MKPLYLFLAAFLLLLRGSTLGQTCATPSAVQITNIQAGSATVSFTIAAPTTSHATGTYSYGGNQYTLPAPVTSPVQLTGLPASTPVTVSLRCVCSFPPSGIILTSQPTTVSFTTAGALAVRAGTGTGVLILAPNPAQSRVTLTLPEPLAQAALVLILDALGRSVRQQDLAAQASTATLDLSGLPTGLYLVRCGGATSRLMVE